MFPGIDSAMAWCVGRICILRGRRRLRMDEGCRVVRNMILDKDNW